MRHSFIPMMLCVMSLSCAQLKYSQPVILDAQYIPVYGSGLGREIVHYVDNTGSHEQKDWFYEAIVHRKNGRRFYVSIQSIGDSDELLESYAGWVDVKNCLLFPACDTYVDGHPVQYLYDNPYTMEIKDSLVFNSYDDMKMLELVDFDRRSHRVKVKIDYYGEVYLAWISRYCSNAYNSCN